jgi:hypothetical protein
MSHLKIKIPCCGYLWYFSMERENHLSHLFVFFNKYSRRIRIQVVINVLKKLVVRFHPYARLLKECPPSQNALSFNNITTFSWLWSTCSDVNAHSIRLWRIFKQPWYSHEMQASTQTTLKKQMSLRLWTHNQRNIARDKPECPF